MGTERAINGLARTLQPLSEAPWDRAASDGSPLIIRDTGKRELYALELQLPLPGMAASRFSPKAAPLLLLIHLLANDRGVPGLGVNLRGHRQASAGHGIRVLLLLNYAVFDDLSIRRRHLAAHWRRWRSRRGRRLLRGAPRQKHAGAYPAHPHASVFSPGWRLVDGNLDYTRAGQFGSGRDLSRSAVDGRPLQGVPSPSAGKS